MEQDTLFTTTVTGVDRDHALARFSDPVTSQLADTLLRSREGRANSVKPSTHRHRALQCFESGPKIADDVKLLTGIEGVWKRISDLKNMGFLEPTGETAVGTQGRQQEILQITDAGRAALAGLSSQI